MSIHKIGDLIYHPKDKVLGVITKVFKKDVYGVDWFDGFFYDEHLNKQDIERYKDYLQKYMDGEELDERLW